jgi:succinylarginine dihydrolase
VVLTDQELAAVNQACLLTDERYEELTAWINRHYRETLSPGDLGDPELLGESRAALDELTGILGLGNVYDFQRAE